MLFSFGIIFGNTLVLTETLKRKLNLTLKKSRIHFGMSSINNFALSQNGFAK